MCDGAGAGGLGTGALAGAPEGPGTAEGPAPEGPGAAEGPGDEPAGGAAWGRGAAGAGAVRSRIILSNCRDRTHEAIRGLLL